MTAYRSLNYRAIANTASIMTPDLYQPNTVEESDPAVRVMTDFNKVTPYSIAPAASINKTSRKMIACGVRLLFVCDQNDALLGLVTSTDILGEKPILYVNEHGGCRDEIVAKDMMTEKKDLQVLDFRDVEAASVGDIAETMKAFARQHILVVEPSPSGEEIIRGLFSTSQISRQLGRVIELSGRANSFAELEKSYRCKLIGVNNNQQRMGGSHVFSNGGPRQYHSYLSGGVVVFGESLRAR